MNLTTQRKLRQKLQPVSKINSVTQYIFSIPRNFMEIQKPKNIMNLKHLS